MPIVKHTDSSIFTLIKNSNVNNKQTSKQTEPSAIWLLFFIHVREIEMFIKHFFSNSDLPLFCKGYKGAQMETLCAVIWENPSHVAKGETAK